MCRTTRTGAGAKEDRLNQWPRAKNVSENSPSRACLRLTSRWSCCAKISREPMLFPLLVIGWTALGTTLSKAFRSMVQWSAGEHGNSARLLRHVRLQRCTATELTIRIWLSPIGRRHRRARIPCKHLAATNRLCTSLRFRRSRSGRNTDCLCNASPFQAH